MTDECEHSWDTDQEVRICGRCGQVRTFPKGEENPRVIWPGRGAEGLPEQLPWADKELIARVAKARVAKGYPLKQLAELIGINMFLLRGWIGGLSKTEPTAQEEVPAAPTAQELPKPRKKKLVGRYYEQNRELMISDYKSMTLLNFFKKWGMSSPTWMKLRALWGVPKKGRGGTARVPASMPQEEPPQARANPDSKSMEEEIAALKIEAAEFRGYKQAVRDIFGVGLKVR